MRIVKQSVQLVQCTPEPEKLIERMGRICYKSEDKITEDSSKKFLEMLLARGHESVLEHAVASFIITTSRGVTHEIVRHRIASYSQESTRFCNYSKDGFGSEITVIEPPGLNDSSLNHWTNTVLECEENYMKMIKDGVKPETARSILPTCLKADIGVTMNFRQLRHFLRLRTSKAAHPEMREIAFMIATELAKISPTLFSEFLPKEAT